MWTAQKLKRPGLSRKFKNFVPTSSSRLSFISVRKTNFFTDYFWFIYLYMIDLSSTPNSPCLWRRQTMVEDFTHICCHVRIRKDGKNRLNYSYPSTNLLYPFFFTNSLGEFPSLVLIFVFQRKTKRSFSVDSCVMGIIFTRFSEICFNFKRKSIILVH